MDSRSHHRLLLGFNLLYLLPFSGYYIVIGNYEFIWYIIIMTALIAGVVWLHGRVGLSLKLLWGLSLWGLFHMAGGGLRINGLSLYDTAMFPLWVTERFYILKFDQFVHLYLYFLVVFLLYEVITHYAESRINRYVLYSLITLASIGIGALNEVAEFTAVLVFQDTGVGDYYNNAWDIVFNTLGALGGILVLHLSRGKEDR